MTIAGRTAPADHRLRWPFSHAVRVRPPFASSVTRSVKPDTIRARSVRPRRASRPPPERRATGAPRSRTSPNSGPWRTRDDVERWPDSHAVRKRPPLRVVRDAIRAKRRSSRVVRMPGTWRDVSLTSEERLLARRARRQSNCRLHHITTRGNNRRTIFEDRRRPRAVLLAPRRRRISAYDGRVPPGRADGQPRPPASRRRDRRRCRRSCGSSASGTRSPTTRGTVASTTCSAGGSTARDVPDAAARPRGLRLPRDEPRPRRPLPAPRRVGVRVVPRARSAGASPGRI